MIDISIISLTLYSSVGQFLSILVLYVLKYVLVYGPNVEISEKLHIWC